MIETPAPRPTSLSPLRVGILIGVAVIAAALVWAFAISGSDHKSAASTSKPTVATVAGLQQLAGTLRHPIYWSGEKSGYTYELTRTKNDNVYVRYLPKGVQVGDRRADFLTVGTYPQVNPMRSITAALKRQGTTRFAVPGGGVAVQYAAHPTSVYVAFPGSSLLVEIFEPSPAQARAVARSGAIRPLG
jgi:hypothetical protein